MKTALLHYWLTNMRGGEKVLAALGEMLPEADIFTHAYRPERFGDPPQRPDRRFDVVLLQMTELRRADAGLLRERRLLHPDLLAPRISVSPFPCRFSSRQQESRPPAGLSAVEFVAYLLRSVSRVLW